MKHILIYFFILLPYISSAQKESYDSLRAIIEKDLNLLDSYNYWDSTFDNTNIDSIASLTSKRLVNLLSYNESLELEKSPLNNLKLTTSYGDSIIRVYGFYYSSGGSRGSISNSIIQWKKSNGSLGSYDLTKKIYSSFYKIYKLDSKNKNLFLLLGSERGNTSEILYTTFVIQFNKDYLILDYPAFFELSYITFINAHLSFDEKNQTLKAESYVPRYKKNEEEKNEIYEGIIECFNDEGICKLKFDGNKFIK